MRSTTALILSGVALTAASCRGGGDVTSDPSQAPFAVVKLYFES
jgi:hypothetical protein